MNDEDCDKREIQLIKPSILVYAFTCEIVDKKILCQVLKMSQLTFICINYVDNLCLNEVALAMITDNAAPVGTQLIGDFSDCCSKNLALKLSKKLNKNVYVSCNIDLNRLILPLVEKCLYEEIKRVADKF